MVHSYGGQRDKAKKRAQYYLKGKIAINHLFALQISKHSNVATITTHGVKTKITKT